MRVLIGLLGQAATWLIAIKSLMKFKYMFANPATLFSIGVTSLFLQDQSRAQLLCNITFTYIIISFFPSFNLQ